MLKHDASKHNIPLRMVQRSMSCFFVTLFGFIEEHSGVNVGWSPLRCFPHVIFVVAACHKIYATRHKHAEVSLVRHSKHKKFFLIRLRECDQLICAQTVTLTQSMCESAPIFSISPSAPIFTTSLLHTQITSR